MQKILRKPTVSAETGGKGCRKSCDVRKRAENIGEPRKSLLRDRRLTIIDVAVWLLLYTPMFLMLLFLLMSWL